jgi:hypothetical protein
MIVQRIFGFLLYLTAFYCTWRRSTVPDGVLLYLTAFYCTWRRSIVPDGVLLYLTAFYCTWRRSIVPDGLLFRPKHAATKICVYNKLFTYDWRPCALSLQGYSLLPFHISLTNYEQYLMRSYVKECVILISDLRFLQCWLWRLTSSVKWLRIFWSRCALL